MFFPALDCLVRDEPGVPPAVQVVLDGFPPSQVGLVLVGYADGEAVEGDAACLSEVEEVLMALVEESASPYRLVVADGDVSGDVWVVSHVILGYAY